MSDGLRLMIYDKTALDDGFDLTKQNDYLTMFWVFGARLYRSVRSLDLSYGASSWEDAVDWLLKVSEGKKISQIQFWGHGWSGRAYIGKEYLTGKVFNGSAAGNKLKQLKDRLSHSSVIWFRTCGTFCGTMGHEFARSWANNMGCRVAGHTRIISYWQGGLYSLLPGQTPHWSKYDGIAFGSANWPSKLYNSFLWTPRTINCLRSEVPKGW